MTSKPDTWSPIHKKTNPNELVVLKKLEKFERISLWSDWLSYFKLFLANEKLITYISISINILPQIYNNSNTNDKFYKINDIIICR